MEVPDAMISDAIKKKVRYKYYMAKKVESEKAKIVDEPEEQHVSPVKSRRGKGLMCYGDQVANVPNKLKKEAVPRKIKSLTIAENAVVDMYNEWGQKLKGPAVEDIAVQSLLDLQKGSKASRLKSLRQKKQPVIEEGSSSAHNKYYSSSDTDSDATLYSSCSEKSKESKNETDDADESNMDLFDDNLHEDDDAASDEGDVSKPRSFERHMSKSTKPHPCFYNNDYTYLVDLNTEDKYTTSITKHYATRYYKDGIEDGIPERWSKEVRRYHFEALNGIHHWEENRINFFKAALIVVTEENIYSDLGIKSAVHIVIGLWFSNINYKFVKYFKNALLMFMSQTMIKNKVEDIQLEVESYQRTLNLTKPIMVFEEIDQRIPLTMTAMHKGVVYLKQYNIKYLMKLSEVKKFCDGTLVKIQENLIDMQSKNKLGSDNKRHIELPRRLEEYVGGRPKNVNPHTFDFLRKILIDFGFHSRKVSWIMKCVASTSFSMSVNGSLHGFFKGRRGLRQGDPLSLYLFTLVMEILTIVLKRNVREANDFTFRHKKSVLGLVPSLPKSTTYFCNDLNHTKLAILGIFPSKEGTLPVNYLRVPLVTTRFVYRDSKELAEKVKKRIEHYGFGKVESSLIVFHFKLNIFYHVLDHGSDHEHEKSIIE
nr:hypothetical protein [Tanacetum cinerariifolium]